MNDYQFRYLIEQLKKQEEEIETLKIEIKNMHKILKNMSFKIEKLK